MEFWEASTICQGVEEASLVKRRKRNSVELKNISRGQGETVGLYSLLITKMACSDQSFSGCPSDAVVTKHEENIFEPLKMLIRQSYNSHFLVQICYSINIYIRYNVPI